MSPEVTKSDDEWKAQLDPERFHVLREKGTEPAWTGTLLDVHDPGLFRCAGCGAELFRSDDKFESGSGWPSFTKAVAGGVIDKHEDRTFGMRRTEITCARCGGHLGHVFPDGPAPTGMRYCVNSLSLEFEPEESALILDRFRLTDSVAVVTGAGRGIGAASAVGLAEAGADVVISARTEKQLHAVAARIEAVGRKAVVVPADLSDLDALSSLAETAAASFGRLDIVVNNVGGAMPRPLLDTTAGFLERAFHFNVTTAHTLTKAAVPLMLEHGGGAVVNITSSVGRTQARGFAAYGTAKAALSHFTRLAAADLAPRIRVNAVAVGSVATSALEVVLTDDTLRQAMEDATPLHRIGDPEDIAAAVVYLASPAGSYLTGKVLEVDGGLDRPNMDLGLPDL